MRTANAGRLLVGLRPIPARLPRMGWNSLATQFCLELTFGVFLALAFVPKAPVGVLFYRVMATAAVVPLLLAALVPPIEGAAAWTDPGVLAAFAALASFPIISGPFRGAKWAFGLGWGLLWTTVALVLTISGAGMTEGALQLATGSLSAMATGAVAGSVGLAMVLGHWYLTVPKLKVEHLVRLNRVTIGSMLISLAALGLSILVFDEELSAARRPLLSPWGMFYLGARIAVGLALPLLFAWMTAGSLKFKNTRSATGILYASTVLVLIGTAVSISLQDSYGVPL